MIDTVPVQQDSTTHCCQSIIYGWLHPNITCVAHDQGSHPIPPHPFPSPSIPSSSPFHHSSCQMARQQEIQHTVQQQTTLVVRLSQEIMHISLLCFTKTRLWDYKLRIRAEFIHPYIIPSSYLLHSREKNNTKQR